MCRLGVAYSFAWLVAIASGCSSIHSTHLKRNEDICGWDTKHLHGIPITLDVPEKFNIEIIETRFYYKDGQGNGKVLYDAKDGKPIVTRNVNVSVKNKKEIFTVDFIKPGAGQLTTGVDLDAKNQYFSEINNKITDTTIDSITAAINTIGGSLAPLTGGKATGFTPPNYQNLTPIDKTVAIGVFDVNDRQVLEKIHAFLCEHLNGCTPPCLMPQVVGAEHLQTMAPRPNAGVPAIPRVASPLPTVGVSKN
jgi:hypothetical protein